MYIWHLIQQSKHDKQSSVQDQRATRIQSAAVLQNICDWDTA